jgi:hypothetical protein
MATMRRLFFVLSATLAVGFTLAGPASAAGAPSAPGPAATTSSASGFVIFDLFYNPYPARPKRYFFTANSGPVLGHLKWERWGKRRPVARGRYVLDCGTCGPTREVYRAKVELKGRLQCKGNFSRFRSYRAMTVTVFYPEPEGTRSRTFPMGCPPPGTELND